MKIKSIRINKFRNIDNITYNLDGVSCVFKGENRLGKTNTLNAIYWCLTGTNLENGSNDYANIPYNAKREEGDVVIDVEITTTDNTKIERVSTIVKGSLSQKIIINGIEQETLKNGDIKIDKQLGILELTLAQSKDFIIKRFLLNPLYFTYCPQKSFRQFIISLIKDKIDTKAVFESSLNDLAKSVLKPLLNAYDNDIEVCSTAISQQVKLAKKSIEEWKAVLRYLNKYQNDNFVAYSQAENLYETQCKQLALLEEQQVNIDLFALALAKKYNEVCRDYFNGVELCLLEKGGGDDVWKEVCYPYVPATKTPINYGSTSERYETGSKLIKAFVQNAKIDSLPILIDQFESVDKKHAITFNELDTQVIGASVVNSVENIKVEKL